MNFLYPNYNYLVLDTVQAAGADWDLTNGVFSVGNPLQTLCKYNSISKASISAAVAEQLQVTTLTPVAANNSTYEILISQFNPVTGKTMVFQYSYTTAASGDTATTIGDYFRDLINADQLIKIAATGTTTLILTAEAGYAVFTVAILQTGGGFTQSTGTAGIQARGTTAALALQGITVTNAAYTTVHIEYTPISGADVNAPIGVKNAIDIYINEGAANFSSLIGTTGKLSYTLAGRLVSTGSTSANPEAIALV